MTIKIDEVLEKLSKNPLYSNVVGTLETEEAKRSVELQTKQFVEALCGPLIQCIAQIQNDPIESEKLRSILQGPIQEKTIVTINGDDGK